MSTMTLNLAVRRLLFALRCILLLTIVPSALLAGIVYCASAYTGYPAPDLTLLTFALMALPCSGLSWEAYWRDLPMPVLPSIEVDPSNPESFWTCDHGHPFCEDHTHSVDYHTADCYCGKTEARCPWETGKWEEHIADLEAKMPKFDASAVAAGPEPLMVEVEGGTRISAEIKADDLATHRSNVHRDGGTIVSSSPIGHGDRYMVTAHYPTNAFN